METTQAIIRSMTAQERARPEVIDGSRRRRIARGSGVEAQDVAALVKSFEQIRGMVKQMSSAGAFGKDKMAAMKAMQGMDLFGHGPPKKRMRSARKKKDRKRRSR
jgi:signal recognition particle subunit SRP54